jgi:hypothetical protein
MTSLKIATWNLDGLSPNKDEVEILLNTHNIDILLVSETHFTANSNVKIKNYEIYATNHPDGTAHAGAAVIVKSNIKHFEQPQFKKSHIQAATIGIQDRNGTFNVSAVYSPPKHKITVEQYNELFNTLGVRFIVGGDWNAKNLYWGSRLTNTRGRELKKSLEKNNLKTISTAEPTNWPSDPNRLPDVIDFFIVKGLSRLFHKIQTCLDANSNHVPVILTIGTTAINITETVKLYNKRTDWVSFQELVHQRLDLQIALKTEPDIDKAAKTITTTIQECCWQCTPVTTERPLQRKVYSESIRLKINDKRRLRRVWHTSRHPSDKAAFNKAARELKTLITEANDTALQTYLEGLTATKATNHSLWGACKNFDRPLHHKPPLRTQDGGWARSGQTKAEEFAKHLSHVFKPNNALASADELDIDSILNQDFQLDRPLKPVTPSEVIRHIKSMDDNKAPGFDLVDKKVLGKLPRKAIVYLTILFNAILRVGYFPDLWKVSLIIMIHKPGKPPHEVTSYRPISLLPIMSKLFEKCLLYRLNSALREKSIIPDHQFGFRREHSTIEQVHRVCRKIRKSFEMKEYCSSAFLDIQQAFDKVWHKGLLCKIRSLLPHPFYGILKSYISNRIFQVRESDSTSGFHEITAGVPQGSVLGPVLHTLFTSDLPQSSDTTIATFADDTALLASNKCPVKASRMLQNSLIEVEKWLAKWRIAVSVTKSTHITFTLRKEDCAPVTLNGVQLPHQDTVKYLGMHLDRRLTWQKHIKTKRDEINLRYKGLYWLMGRNSKLAMDNKILIYKTMIKPIWTYGIQLWGAACATNLMIVQRVQNNILRQISNAPWFLKTTELHEILDMATVKQEITSYGDKYKARLHKHPNQLAEQLTIPETIRRLKRKRDILDQDSQHVD